MPRNDAAAPGQLCPGSRIHAIDIIQPPGIVIPPIVDRDTPQTMVPAVLAANSSPETPRNACREARSEDMARAPPCNGHSALLVLVVAAPPDAGFVAAHRGSVEPLIHAPEAI